MCYVVYSRKDARSLRLMISFVIKRFAARGFRET